MEENRAFFARSFCSGRGIEIGALHHPVPMPPGARVRYLDRMPVADLRLQYPELAGEDLVPVDIVDSGETLATVPDASEDFVVASQFIEHCENPIRALINMLRVVRMGGFIVLTVPDKRRTFDKDRAVTPNEHLLEECVQGPERNTREHYREAARQNPECRTEAEVDRYADELMRKGYSIHFHVWDGDAFLRFLFFIKERFRLPLELWATLRNGNELMVAIRKSWD